MDLRKRNKSINKKTGGFEFGQQEHGGVLDSADWKETLGFGADWGNSTPLAGAGYFGVIFSFYWMLLRPLNTAKL